MNDHTVLRKLAFRTLWLAYVWNDHNFKAAHIEAREACEKLGIHSFDEANAWLEKMDKSRTAKEEATSEQPTNKIWEAEIARLEHELVIAKRGNEMLLAENDRLSEHAAEGEATSEQMGDAQMAKAERDGCKFCLGAKGGVPGNENVVGGQMICDYCTALLMSIKEAEIAKPTGSLFATIQPTTAEPVARLMHWNGPAHYPIPHGGICARTFVEFPKGAGENGGYWTEGGPLYTAPVAPADAARNARDLVLEEAAQACDRYPSSHIGVACAQDIRAMKSTQRKPIK